MKRFVFPALLTVVFSILLTDACLSLELLLDDSEQLALDIPLPTLLTQGPATRLDQPQHWLSQDYSATLYQAAIRPGPHASWHKINLVGKFGDARLRKKVLVVSSHTLQHLHVYLFEGEKLITAKAMGLKYARRNGLHYNDPHFGFHIKDGQRLTLLIVKQSDGRGLLPLDIYSEQQYAQVVRRQHIFWAAVIAVLLVMALYNVMVYTMHPNTAYLWYLAFHTTAFMHISAQNGLGFWLWPDAMQIYLAQHVQFINFLLAFTVFNFSRVFLESKQNAPWHHQFIPYFSALTLAGAACSLFVAEYNMIPVFSTLLLVGSIFGLSMGYIALKNNFYPARYFLLSWTFVAAGSVVSMATAVNLLVANFFTMHSFLFGTITELFLLSVALASRIKHTEQALLSHSYIHRDSHTANFSYLRQVLPVHLPELLTVHPRLVILVANMSGFREIMNLYGPTSLTSIYQFIGARSSRFLAKQSWSVALPMPTQEPIYLVSLPGEQIFMLISVKKINAHADLENIVHSLMKDAKKTINLNGIQIDVNIEVGCAYLNSKDEFQECFRQAQTALLSSTQHNKPYQLYNPNQDSVISARISLMHDLKDAIDEQDLKIHIQPQFTLKDHVLSGGEILIRWSHPLRGNINPGQFIPLAESSGLIYTITQLVIKQTCQWLMQLKQKNEKWLDDFTVSINLSALDLAQPNLLPFLQDCLNQYHVNAKNIMIEVTESAVMNNPDEFLNTIKQLKQAGFTISIDDFGTGYSSMMYLQTMQADEIKIDLAFIRNIHIDKTKQNIVAAIIELAHSTNAHTVAEGVECQEEADYLATLNCHIAQGYYWSPAIPMKDFEEQYLRKN